MHELASIPEGRAGLDAKVAKVRALVEAAKRRPSFRAMVCEIVGGVGERDTASEIAAVFDFVRDRVRYVRDPWSPGGLELFTEPELLLREAMAGTAAGDCDDHVILASAMLETIGYETRYRIGGLPPDHFRHIWLEVRDRSGWVPLELVKKDEPIGYDPSHRFPLTLTLNGAPMNYQGLGATPKANRMSGGEWQSLVDKEHKRVQARIAQRFRDQAAHKRIVELRPGDYGSDLRSRDRLRGPSFNVGLPSRHQSRRRFIDLGDYEVPPSFTNTPQEARWYGFTPSDVWRDDELADYELVGLGGLTKKIKKLAKKVKKSSAFQDLKKLNKKLVDPREHLKALKKGVKGVVGIFGGGKGTAEASSAPEPQPRTSNPYTDPGSTGLAPPSLFNDGSGGGGAGEGAEPYDPWGQFDAQTEEQEIDSLYTEATAEEIGPDQPMPGAGEGSYVPTPEWEGTSNPFTQPTDGDEGMDYNAMDVSDPTAVYGENEGGALGDWLTDLVGSIGNVAVGYGKARLDADLARRGIVPAAVTAPTVVPPVATTPVPSVPAQPPANIIVQQPAQEPRRFRRSEAGAGLAKWGPYAMAGIGLVVVLALMKGSRRSR